jgi:hypothetical protein
MAGPYGLRHDCRNIARCGAISCERLTFDIVIPVAPTRKVKREIAISMSVRRAASWIAPPLASVRPADGCEGRSFWLRLTWILRPVAHCHRPLFLHSTMKTALRSILAAPLGQAGAHQAPTIHSVSQNASAAARICARMSRSQQHHASISWSRTA